MHVRVGLVIEIEVLALLEYLARANALVRLQQRLYAGMGISEKKRS